MSSVFLSLGSNMGDRRANLKEALERLDQLPQTQLLAVSSLYQTPAWGLTEQADFLNLACRLETILAPLDLLRACQSIENDLGRVRQQHWGPRTLDIDILLYDQKVLDQPDLTLPHPYMKERAFVLVPLLEMDNSLADPVTDLLYAADLAKLSTQGIEKISGPLK
ncbi:2-amino-4-hydroxy-6-hydroxymethyldihydropteridine diphosphokinase [Streptococcus sobrinus]|uniref:2-amino-4-hydroxy-6-hydroxymethyldihydropteridine diphosphokinase n=11 Tax=Streptococcus sobrinus TaxID=1310 RepID=U2KB02_9STRE|nr:2-amino-4-hydroxy-6-hydroxymethyldihydropteridine diphosphokinase [Streptococcus sobrinus]AWN18898.1 2-amino-4-hydroxy-6-hydroxymethyldihydropteridine diphosphokinase [Streptococcus sobrinus]AWN61636.1 2-amino-4-hydroxy-6-hydroxymethyldihydropteridine diphosphokinase [Streptococcus sobrinus]AWN63507.1 2-amino-4-hydroxy-6-hydroxymethyldihydropteridine diphosphokinase [Streptococcus sobrinus]ERJ74349.1 2-amino-4-hydroxy-6-hydroxymethyldihydropteridine diphosphokinase [Streptococcus sobrinus W1